MAKKIRKSADTAKKWKKQWFSIVAPPIFNNTLLGDTPVNEVSELKGRVISVTMADLIGDMRRQYIRVNFKVKDVKDGKAQTEVIGYEISPAHLKRLGKRSGIRLEDSFIVSGKDAKFRIKPLLLTRNKIQRSVGSALRKKAQELIVESLKDKKIDQVFSSVTRAELQRSLKKELSKTYPIAICEIKKLVLL